LYDACGKILSVDHLNVSYDSIHAVDDITFDVGRGEIVTLIGANGAGKSSILRAISGLVSYGGSIRYAGRDMKNIAADRIVAAGIAHVPEGRGIFGNLTVMENLKLATWQRKDKEQVAKDFENVFSLFPRLRERRKQQGGMLSGGEQQMLAFGRALMTDAQTLLLDEPPWGSRRCWCGKFSKSFRTSTEREKPFCWLNKTPTCRCTLLRMATFWKRVASFFPAPAKN